MLLYVLLILSLLLKDALGATVETSIASFMNKTGYAFDSELEISYDPPAQYESPTALGVFVWTPTNPSATIYYDALGQPPTFSSPTASADSPYILLDTPFKASRDRNLSMIAVYVDEGVTYIGQPITITYFVEASARPYSYGFLVPGIESGGYFVQFKIEVAATARAQVAGGQEFADFFSEGLRIGTYPSQIQAIHLLTLDPDLQGFEGGFPYTTGGKHYGLLIPYHNGIDFFGKLVRVDLQGMLNATKCAMSYRSERYNADGDIIVTPSNAPERDEACVMVMDLTTIHSNARGFRRGFLGFPYGYIASGEYNVLARIDLVNFGIETVKTMDLGLIDRTYGGYSGGFSDGTWACFNPFRTFSGEVGGIRSELPVDANHLRPYFYATMLCINDSAWELDITKEDTKNITSHLYTMDFSSIENSLRGFSDALRVGRYAYLAPLNSAEHVYSAKLVRISLGYNSIGETLKNLYDSNGILQDVVDILDLSKIDDSLKGYSGLFSSGNYLFLVPYRNAYEPQNGQRGHGTLTRLNMNDFSTGGINYLDLPTAVRTQIPSFADVNLRGFSYGFASGQYGLLVPFFNAIFNGKIARFLTLSETFEPTLTNIQELDVTVDRTRKNVYKGFRGGFVSLWQGVDR